MSIVANIGASYLHPRKVMRGQMQGAENEGRVLVYLIVACLLIIIAQWPRLARQAVDDPSTPLNALMWAAMWAWLFIAPIMFYVLAWISFLIARVMKGRGSAYAARLALFWALLAVTPLWLLYGLVAGFIGAGMQLSIVGVLVLGAFCWIWISSMAEAHKG